MTNHPRELTTRRSILAAGLALGLALAGMAARATTIVPVADEDLVDQAEVIVRARIAAVGPAPTAGAHTDYTAVVDEVLKGNPESPLVVRVLGGETADGLTLHIYGAPHFRPGENVLLFLARHADGAYRVLHLTLGAFHVVESDGTRLALRNLRDVALPALGGPPRREALRDADRFVDWICDRVAGRSTTAGYAVEDADGSLRSIADRFTLFVGSDGKHDRWFDFDSGGHVTWKALASGQPGVAGGGFTEFQNALAAWTNDAHTTIDYRYGGTTSGDAGFTHTDGQNSILFEDPNHEITSPFSCATGGVLAWGGPFSQTTLTMFKGTSYHKIVEAEVVMNKGIGCTFAASSNASKLAEEIYGHELGHTLGLDHSCDEDATTPSPSCSSSALLDDALMRWLVHDDGRGARLNSDDQAGIYALYPAAGGSGPCVEDAATACLQGGRFEVKVNYQSASASGPAQIMLFNGQRGETSDTAFLWFFSPTNFEMGLKILNGCTLNSKFWVFIGGLTNQGWTVNLRDTTNGATKTYSNALNHLTATTADTAALSCP